jgi:hypothetical protein
MYASISDRQSPGLDSVAVIGEHCPVSSGTRQYPIQVRTGFVDKMIEFRFEAASGVE